MNQINIFLPGRITLGNHDREIFPSSQTLIDSSSFQNRKNEEVLQKQFDWQSFKPSSSSSSFEQISAFHIEELLKVTQFHNYIPKKNQLDSTAISESQLKQKDSYHQGETQVLESETGAKQQLSGFNSSVKKIRLWSEFIPNIKEIMKTEEEITEKTIGHEQSFILLPSYLKLRVSAWTEDPSLDKKNQQERKIRFYQAEAGILLALSRLIDRYGVTSLSSEITSNPPSQALLKFSYTPGIVIFKQIIAVTTLRSKIVEMIWNLKDKEVQKAKSTIKETLTYEYKIERNQIGKNYALQEGDFVHPQRDYQALKQMSSQ